MSDEVIEKAIQAHLNTLVVNGTITVKQPDSKRDIAIYLRSGAFMQFQASLYTHTADLIKQGKE